MSWTISLSYYYLAYPMAGFLWKMPSLMKRLVIFFSKSLQYNIFYKLKRYYPLNICLFVDYNVLEKFADHYLSQCWPERPKGSLLSKNLVYIITLPFEPRNLGRCSCSSIWPIIKSALTLMTGIPKSHLFLRDLCKCWWLFLSGY